MPSEISTGAVLAGFRVESLIGQGAMGTPAQPQRVERLIEPRATAQILCVQERSRCRAPRAEAG